MKFDLNFLNSVGKFPYVLWERVHGGTIYDNPGAAVLSWCSSRNFNFTAVAPSDIIVAALECEKFASASNLNAIMKSMKDQSIAKNTCQDEVVSVAMQLHVSGHDVKDVDFYDVKDSTLDLLQSIIDLHFKLS